MYIPSLQQNDSPSVFTTQTLSVDFHKMCDSEPSITDIKHANFTPASRSCTTMICSLFFNRYFQRKQQGNVKPARRGVESPTALTEDGKDLASQASFRTHGLSKGCDENKIPLPQDVYASFSLNCLSSDCTNQEQTTSRTSEQQQCPRYEEEQDLPAHIIIKQLETRPILQEQLYKETMGIYKGIGLLESKCAEVDSAQVA